MKSGRHLSGVQFRAKSGLPFTFVHRRSLLFGSRFNRKRRSRGQVSRGRHPSVSTKCPLMNQFRHGGLLRRNMPFVKSIRFPIYRHTLANLSGNAAISVSISLCSPNIQMRPMRSLALCQVQHCALRRQSLVLLQHETKPQELPAFATRLFPVRAAS
jgi:hypothetical protein